MRCSLHFACSLSIAALLASACVAPSKETSPAAASPGTAPTSTAEVVTLDPALEASAPPQEPIAEIDAWAAARQMSPGVNIGNTFDNTTRWETGWGNPSISEAYVQYLKSLGFKSIRLPVAWDTYAVDGRIQPDKMQRVREVVDWITKNGLYCIVNIHWDGGWIDSDVKEKYPKTFHTFSDEADKKYRGYWAQISRYFAGKNEKLVFEALNEETNFENEGAKAYQTLTHVNQSFVDTVRSSGGNNAKRLLIVTGYTTDITKTCSDQYALPKDTVPHRLFISVHYYTPWQFVGMTEDASWGKMSPTWGSESDVAELDKLFDMMAGFSTKNDIPAYIGEFGVSEKKESASRVRWLSAVMKAALTRKMVPVLWDTGNDISRHPPYKPNPDLAQALEQLPPSALQPAP